MSYHKLILPFGIIMLVSCVLMTLSYQDHLQTGELVLKWLFPIFAVFSYLAANRVVAEKDPE